MSDKTGFADPADDINHLDFHPRCERFHGIEGESERCREDAVLLANFVDEHRGRVIARLVCGDCTQILRRESRLVGTGLRV